MLDAVARLVAHEGYALIGLDPISGRRSLMFSHNGVGPARALAHNEHRQHDVNRYADLARRTLPAGVLNANDMAGSRSQRMRTILRPCGYTSEMRLVLRAHRRVWGALTLFRSECLPPFNEADTVVLAALSDALCSDIRNFTVRRTTQPCFPLQRGVAVLDKDDVVTARSPAFDLLQRELGAGGRDDMTAEDALRIVFDAAAAARATSVTATVCLRAMSGRWISLQADPLDTEPERVIATLSPATLHEVMPSYAAWNGLTSRESQVLGLLANGDPTKGLARSLGISRYTVEDHLRSIYRKTCTDGRDDLLGAVLTGA